MLFIRAHRALLILPLALSFFPALPFPAYGADADEIQKNKRESLGIKEKAERDAADVKVAAAKTPVDRLNALYERAGVPMGFPEPTYGDWEQAGLALDEIFKTLGEMERDGKTKLTGKGKIYFRGGYVANKLKNFKGAIFFLDKAEKEDYLAASVTAKNKGSELFTNRGLAKAALYDFPGAIADYDKAIALVDNGLWRKYRAETRFELGDYDGAVADWRRAVELGAVQDVTEDDADFLDQTLDGKQDDKAKVKEVPTPFDRALIPFNKAIAANPASASAILMRANYRIKKAKANFPTNSTYDDVFASVLGDVSSDKTIEIMRAALKDIDRAINVEPKSAEAWRERGRTRTLYMTLKSGQKDRGFTDEDPYRDFVKALGLDPKSAATRFELGEYFLNRNSPKPGAPLKEEEKSKRENDLRSAILNYSHAIYLSPDASGDAHFQRALAERQLPAPDIHTLLTDYEAVIAQDMKSIGEAPEKDKKDTALAMAHAMRGRILGNLGQRAAALNDYDKAIALDQNNFEARFERGKLRVIRGEYAGALEDLNLVTQKRPRFAEAWLLRGIAHDGKGETAEARSALQEAFKRDAKLRERVRGSRYDEQTPNPQVALAPVPTKGDIKQVPPGTALDHKNAGNALRDKGNDEGALAEYSTAILIDPNFADGYNNRASVYIDQKKYDLALADLNRAIEIDPKHRVAYVNRADLWDKLGENDKQRTELDRAIEYADTPVRKAGAYVRRAKVRFTAKDQTGANSDLKMASEQAPQESGVWGDIALAQLTFEQYAEAAASFRRSLELKPGASLNALYLASALTLANDPAAPGELEKALAGAKPSDIKDVSGYIRFLLNRKPDSAPLKSLLERLNKTNL